MSKNYIPYWILFKYLWQKKQLIKITSEGLNLLTAVNFSSIAEMNGFYNKEIFFSEGFSGNVQYLFQALGSLGAHPRYKDLNIDISLIIISNKIIESLDTGNTDPFIIELEERLNRNNSAYRRMKFISENHLIWNIENRIKLTSDDVLEELIKKYKESRKQQVQQNLFE
jgi:hypothetical protein